MSLDATSTGLLPPIAELEARLRHADRAYAHGEYRAAHAEYCAITRLLDTAQTDAVRAARVIGGLVGVALGLVFPVLHIMTPFLAGWCGARVGGQCPPQSPRHTAYAPVYARAQKGALHAATRINEEP